MKTRATEEAHGGNWSQQQQRALEAALAQHPKGGAGDRWQKIANQVPGKTKVSLHWCFRVDPLLRRATYGPSVDP